MSNDNNNSFPKWRATQAEFMGYVKGKLEAIHSDLAKHERSIENFERRISSCESDIKAIKTGAGVIGSVAGLLGGLVFNALSILLRSWR